MNKKLFELHSHLKRPILAIHQIKLVDKTVTEDYQVYVMEEDLLIGKGKTIEEALSSLPSLPGD